MSSAQQIILSLLTDPPSQWSPSTWSCLLLPLAALLAIITSFMTSQRAGNRIPGPPSNSFLAGNYSEYRRKSGPNRNVSAFYEWLHQQYGTVARYWLGPSSLWVSVSDPARAKDVLQKATERPPMMKKLLQFLGDENQTFKKAEFAKPHRTVLLQHLASPKALQRLGAIARTVAGKTRAAWEVHAQQGLSLDLCAELTAAAAEVMTQGLFGEPFQRLSLEDKEGFVRHLATAVDGATKWGTRLVPPVWNRSYREWRNSGGELHRIAARMLKNARAEDEPNLVAAALRSRHSDGGRVTSTIEERTSFLIGAAFGGYDTTAMAMAWAALKVAEHPEVQAEVQRELDAKVEGAVPMMEELPRLDYLGGVILETGRLWPAASALLRHSADTDLQVGGFTVPAGANIVVPIQTIHRSTAVWGSDATQFRPDRWRRTSGSLSGLPGVTRSGTNGDGTEPVLSREVAANLSSDARLESEESGKGKVVDLTYAASMPLVGGEKERPFFTFGGGPRSCVGRLFSLTEQKIVLGTLLKRFRVELEPNQGPFSQAIRGFVARPTPSPKILLQVRR